MRQRTMPPVPAGFAALFVDRGWRAIERRYGASNDVIHAWIAHAGGPGLRAKRAAVQKCGARAGHR